MRDHLLSALREDFGEAGPLRSNLRSSARSIEISRLRASGWGFLVSVSSSKC